MPSDFSFDLKIRRARDEINDALGQRVPDLGPPPNQRPMQIPGNPQLTPQGMNISGQQQIGPGMLSGNAMLDLHGLKSGSANYSAPIAGGQLNLGATAGPQGFQGASANYAAPVGPGQLNVGTMFGPSGFEGASANYGMPVGDGELNLGASMDPRMQMGQLNAQYQRGPFSAGVNYQPGGGVSGGVQYRRAFQEGGLATSVRSDPVYHERDVDFINTRNQHMREVAGKQAYAKGGLAEGDLSAMSDRELAMAFSSTQNNSAIINEVNRRIKAKLLDRFNGDEAAASAFLRSTNDPLGVLSGPSAYAKGGGVWTRKEGQNPEGGLNAAGRASLKAQGHDIKPPVSAKQAKKSPKAAARRKSFCARMSGMPGPMKDEKGRPTRKALSLRKWDC